jgi:hypothetical protein
MCSTSLASVACWIQFAAEYKCAVKSKESEVLGCSSLCCTWMCLFCSSLCITLPCLFYSSQSCHCTMYESVLQKSVLSLYNVHVCSIEVCAATYNVCSTTANAVPGGVCSTAVCAVLGRAYSKPACASHGRICSTVVCDVTVQCTLYMPVLQKSVLLLKMFVLRQPVLFLEVSVLQQSVRP